MAPLSEEDFDTIVQEVELLSVSFGERIFDEGEAADDLSCGRLRGLEQLDHLRQ